MNKHTALARTLTVIACALAAVQPALAQQVKDTSSAAFDRRDPERPVIVAQTTADDTPSDDVIVLSPFQVDATREKGYYAENTLAGSRMRTNIADLGAAISVVTKQQLEDTASLDVNDIFRYEIGTEGATTYTPTGLTFRSDGVADAIAGNTFGNNINGTVTNSTANRVRGLGAPSYALNYYSAIAQIPFDSYNASSFEINRGPNSLLFGMGSPAGIVNQSTAQALVNKRTAQVQVRVDDRASIRGSLNFNIPLIKDKLAIYGALLYDDKQYERKPSYDITRRQYGAITYKPFKNTTLRASIEGYSNSNRRPNTLMPRDGVTEWRKAGEPYYDSVTQQVIRRADGQTVGIYSPSVESPNAQQLLNFLATRGVSVANGNLIAVKSGTTTTNYSYNGVNVFGTALMGTSVFTSVAALGTPNQFFVPGIVWQNGRATQQIYNGALQGWVQGSVRQASGFNAAGTRQFVFKTGQTSTENLPNVYANAAWATVFDRGWSESTLSSMTNEITGIFNAQYPAVTDTSIYNWKDVNLLSMNYGQQRNTNYNIEFEQEIIPDLLHFSAGWFRQDFDSTQSYTVAQLNATTLMVDPNKYYPDGTPNPFFGRVLVTDQDPDRYGDSQTNDQYRAMLAFTPDFTKNTGWTKWLGHHQFLGLVSYNDEMRTTYRQRLAYFDGSNYVKLQYIGDPRQPSFSYQASTASRRYFYLSDSGDSVTTATGAGAYNNDLVSGAIRLYDYNTNTWNNEAASMIWPDFNANTTRSARTLTSLAAAWNGYLWNDRIITTLGVRRDINKTRGVTQGAINGQPQLTAPDLYENGYLQLDTFFDRWNPWYRQAGTTTTAGVVMKPFIHWDTISKRSSRSVFWEFVENLGLSFNKSDNFNPPTSTLVDYTGKVLPVSVGDGKDYGVQFTLLKGKLYARLNWFESTNENVAQTPAAVQRLWWHIDSTAYRSWLGFIYMLNNGLDPATNASWQTTAKTYAKNSNTINASAASAMQQWVAQQWQLNNWDYYGNLGGTIAGTARVKAKGTELSVQYNPSSNWTLKLTASKNETISSNVLREYDAWKTIRKAQWDAANASNLLTGAALAKYGGQEVVAADNTRIFLGNFWDSYGYYDTNASNEAGGMTITSDATDPGNRSNLAFYNAVLMTQELAAKASDGALVPDQRKYNAALVTNYVFDHGKFKGWSVGGAQRYSSKAIIGYYGKSSGNIKDATGKPLLDTPDITRPIYDDPMWYTDLWIAYTCKIFHDKVRMKIQLNVADVFQDGELQPVAVNFDGQPYAYRIMDPRTFILTATFDF